MNDRFRAVIQKELIHVRRDRRTLALIILMPVFQLILYGYGINTDVKHLSMAVFDEDRSPLSRQLVESFVQSAYFDVTLDVHSEQELRTALDRGRVKAALHIPPGFARDALGRRGSNVQMLIDGTDSNPANTALNTGQAIVAAFIQSRHLAETVVSPIDFRPRLWYNPDLKSSFFMIPGLVGLLLQLLVPMITSTALVREKERGNIEQLLVTPIRPYELIFGKMVPYICIGVFIAALVIAGAWGLFHVPIRGNFLFLMVATFVFILVCLGIGLLASTVAENQQQAAQIVMMLAPPSILLSGFIFPRETMPWPIYHLGQLIPLTYFVKIIRGIILKGLGPLDLWDQMLPLVLIAAAVMALSVSRFKKRLT